MKKIDPSFREGEAKVLPVSKIKQNGIAGAREKSWEFWVFVGPVFALFTLFFIVPLAQGLYYAFTNWDAINPRINFVGITNFVKIFTIDKYFIPALGRTFYFTVLNVFFVNVFAMLFALALTNESRGNNFFRACIFVPNVISMVIAGFIWSFMFSKILPKIGSDIPLLSFLDQSWTGDEKFAMMAIIIVSVWQGTGYIMTIYIAGLQGMDAGLVEAGKIDGANAWQTFWRIKLPSILPTVAVGSFMNIAGSLKIFDIVYSLTKGGPGRSTEVAMLELYREAYQYKNFGYASAKAVILAVIIIAITLVQQKLTKAKEG